MFRSSQFMLRQASTASALLMGSLCGVQMLHHQRSQPRHRFFALAETPAAATPASSTTVAGQAQASQQSSLNKHLNLAGLGALIGFSAGYAAKKIGRMFLLVLGLEFMFLQSLVALDFITIHWENVGRRTARPLSADGRRQNESRLINVLTTNLPFKGAFIAAFYGGFKFG
jgi:uncharacterized membrane protein (Fun14 family)